MLGLQLHCPMSWRGWEWTEPLLKWVPVPQELVVKVPFPVP